MFRTFVISIVCLLSFMNSINAETYLTNRDYELIKQNYPYYHRASTICDIPVEVLIAIHYRESNLLRGYYSRKKKTVVKNIGGPFMLDCGGEGTEEFEIRIRAHEQKIAKKYSFTGDTRISHNFMFACLVAADLIKQKARYGLDTEEGVADTFWGYNGRAYGSYLNSAYVCSDPKRGHIMTFTFRGKSVVDTRPGCLPIWKELKTNLKGGGVMAKKFIGTYVDDETHKAIVEMKDSFGVSISRLLSGIIKFAADSWKLMQEIKKIGGEKDGS